VKRKPPEHANHERWLVSYADFITLLFAFFVVMFAISQVDAQKLGRFVQSVNVAFEMKGVFPESDPHPIQLDPSAGGGLGIRPNIAPPKITVQAGMVPSRRAQQVRRALESMPGMSRLEGKVHVRIDQRGVTVSLSEAGFFDTGSAQVREDAVPMLRDLAEALKVAESPIAVEGHTDNVPIKTPLYPSNWELSTVRATSIVRYLIEQQGYDPLRLSATGFAEYRPVGDNASPEGRTQNRRVDIVILTETGDGPAPR
jgi:chemotaxis protein MotB